MKQLLSLLILLMLALALCACGGKNPLPAGTDPVESTGTQAPAPDTEAPTEADTHPETLPETEAPTETETEKGLLIAPLSPADGADVSLLSEDMTAWLVKYRKAKLDKISDFTEKCQPVPVTFAWDCAEGAEYYHLSVSMWQDMTAADTYLTFSPSVIVEDLYAGETYYWQVTATYADRVVRSVVFTFRTLAQPRTLEIDGVTNVRDLGGYVTENGQRVRQGIVYRGAHINDITPAGQDKAVHTLGIVTELDVSGGTNTGKSGFGPEVQLFNYAGPWYSGVTSDEYKQALINELRVFTNESNYPIYFHCSLGRDRTGTLACLLLALCGVSQEDITKDYEISFWSATGGTADTSAKPSAMTSSNLGGLISILKGYATKDARDLKSCTEAFMLELGLSDGEIEAIRNILLDDVQ